MTALDGSKQGKGMQRGKTRILGKFRGMKTRLDRVHPSDVGFYGSSEPDPYQDNFLDLCVCSNKRKINLHSAGLFSKSKTICFLGNQSPTLPHVSHVFCVSISL